MSLEDKNVNNTLSEELCEEKTVEVNNGSKFLNGFMGCFLAELIVCSVIIWSIVFIKGNYRYNNLILEIDDAISEKSDNGVINNIEKIVTDSIVKIAVQEE